MSLEVPWKRGRRKVDHRQYLPFRSKHYIFERYQITGIGISEVARTLHELAGLSPEARIKRQRRYQTYGSVRECSIVDALGEERYLFRVTQARNGVFDVFLSERIDPARINRLVRRNN